MNYARDLRGVQIGVINIARSNPKGTRVLPLFNADFGKSSTVVILSEPCCHPERQAKDLAVCSNGEILRLTLGMTASWLRMTTRSQLLIVLEVSSHVTMAFRKYDSFAM